MNERRKETLAHVKRIQGQIDTLVKYIEEGKDCSDIAMLTTSIAKSFDTLRFRTLEGFILNHLLKGKKVPEEKIKALNSLISLYKK
ncbi:metal-sensing transcriptional repressor [Candidatus Desantisbacteria bacterium]|nr:metal-sensing transcriptional repressor [Candidatus Desantisbacteria bacterium]